MKRIIAVACSGVSASKYMPPSNITNSEAFTKGLIHVKNVTNHQTM
jgi:hypothetical protein